MLRGLAHHDLLLAYWIGPQPLDPARLPSDLGVTLGGQQAALDEAANARRLQALTVGPAATSAISGLTSGLGNSALQLGSQIQEDQYLSRPEIQLLRTLSNVFSLSPPSQDSQGTSSQKQGGV